MNVPDGTLLRQRVVSDLSTPLATALDLSVTGYVRLESSDSLLLDTEDIGVITFEEGVPVVAYHGGTDSRGREALADIVADGPSRIELYELDSASLAEIHDTEPLRVPPGLPAQQLAGDTALAQRTREQAPDARLEQHTEQRNLAAIEEFLSDDQRIETIRERAREQATARAEEWGFDVSSN